MKGKYEPEEGEVEREKAMKLQIGGDWWCLLLLGGSCCFCCSGAVLHTMRLPWRFLGFRA